MLTVRDLLDQPLFAEFSVVSDKTGVDNYVMGTGIYDWETPEVIMNTFESGEFVLTKMEKLYQNREEYIECIKLLIEMRMAAIAFKKKKKEEKIPQELIEYANDHNVVLLSFSDTYYDDIIYYVKNAIMSKDNNEILLERIYKLMKTEGKENALSLIQKINPLFKRNCICACIYGMDSGNLEEMIFERLKRICIERDNGCSSVISCSKCLLLIATFDAEYGEDDLDGLVRGLNLDAYIGLSSVMPTSELKNAIEESMISVYAGRVMEKDICCFKDSGAYKLLVPFMKSPWAEKFYEGFRTALQEYDKKHNNNMNDTLITFVECNHDICATADRLFQHSNTVRYRLGRIKDILGIEDETEFLFQAEAYVKLHRLKEMIGEETLL